MEFAKRGFSTGLLLATVLAGALRLAGLGAVPISLYCDEAFHGYEAYCLLATGRDSRGVLLPLFFDIFGKGWGEPLYIYLTVVPVSLMGLTPAAVRLTAALAGTAAVLLTGLMTASLMSSSIRADVARRAGVAAACLMAVSPWAFHLSRVAFQASLLPAALAGGFWLAARPLRRAGPSSPAFVLAPAALVLGLSLYTYTVSRLALPLLLAGFLWTHRRSLWTARRAGLVAAMLLSLIALPIVSFTMTERGRQRFSDVSVLARDEVRREGAAAAVTAIAANYLSYHGPRFLLTEGDANPRHAPGPGGMLHPHDVALMLAGLAGALAARGPGGWFLLWWLAVYPIPAALTIDPRHAVRAICGQPAVYALAGLGAAALWEIIPSRPVRWRMLVTRSALALGLGIALLATAGFFRHYFLVYPAASAPSWQYGLRHAYDYIESLPPGHDSVYVTRNEDFPRAHLLFYRAFPPREYQERGLTRTPYLFDQEVFYRGSRIPGRANPVFLLKPFEVPAGITPRHTILYPDGSEAFVIAW